MSKSKQIKQKTRRPLVGLIVDCTDSYGRSIFRGVMRYANLQRRWLLFKDYRTVTHLNGTWPKMDGAIIGGTPYTVFQSAREITKKIVHCTGSGDPKICPVVSIDDLQVGEMAASHLLECNLNHFAYYGSAKGFSVSELRLAGFRQKLAGAGFECLECPHAKPPLNELVSHHHRPKLIEWLRGLSKPIGVMCFDDTTSHDLAEACLESDIRVPDDVAIIGVNNDDLLCESAWPPLSSVDADYSRIGFAAASLLDRMLSGRPISGAERFTRLPPIRVIQRQSTNILMIKDRNLADAVRFIREHACDPCSVADVLKIVPTGRRWLEREFKSQLGRTLHDEISHTRTKTACRLLVETNLNIEDVSRQCGYASVKSFYNAFRQNMDVTPAEYRRNTRNSSGSIAR